MEHPPTVISHHHLPPQIFFWNRYHLAPLTQSIPPRSPLPPLPFQNNNNVPSPGTATMLLTSCCQQPLHLCHHSQSIYPQAQPSLLPQHSYQLLPHHLPEPHTHPMHPHLHNLSNPHLYSHHFTGFPSNISHNLLPSQEIHWPFSPAPSATTPIGKSTPPSAPTATTTTPMWAWCPKPTFIPQLHSPVHHPTHSPCTSIMLSVSYSPTHFHHNYQHTSPLPHLPYHSRLRA